MGQPQISPACIKVFSCSGSKHNCMRERHTNELLLSHHTPRTYIAFFFTPIGIYICNQIKSKSKGACVVAHTAAGNEESARRSAWLA